MNEKSMFCHLACLFLGLLSCTQLHAAVEVDRAAVYSKVMAGDLENPEQALVLFPDSPDEVVQRAEQAVANAKKEMDSWLAIPTQERTVENTIRRFDAIAASFDNVRNCLETTMLSGLAPQDTLEILKDQVAYLMRLGGDLFQSKNVYRIFKSFQARDLACSMEDQRFLSQVVMSFEKSLSDDDSVNERIKQIEVDTVRIAQEYLLNQEKVERRLLLNDDDLREMSAERKASFAKENDCFLFDLKQSAINLGELSSQGRDKFFRTKFDDVKAANKELVEAFIRLKNEKARLLGYKNYAEYEMKGAFFDNSSVFKSCADLVSSSLSQTCLAWGKSTADKIKNTPESDCLEGDLIRYSSHGFLSNKEKTEQLEDLGDYFSMPDVLRKMCNLYEKFADVRITLTPAGKVDGDVYRFFLACYRAGDGHELIGASIIQLYPASKRPGGTTFPLVKPKQGKTKVVMVTTQYDRLRQGVPCAEKMYTLKNTLHEMGHMMSHYGAHERQAFSGPGLWKAVSRVCLAQDFCEFEGMAIEELCDFPEIVMYLSKHSASGESLTRVQAERFISRKMLYDRVRYQWFHAASLVEVFQQDYTFDQAQNAFWQIYKSYHPEVQPLSDLGWLADYKWLVRAHTGPLMYKYALALFAGHYAVHELKRQGLDVWQIGSRLIKKGVMQSGSLTPREVIESVTGKPFVLKQALKSYLKDLIEMASVAEQ